MFFRGKALNSGESRLREGVSRGREAPRGAELVGKDGIEGEKGRVGLVVRVKACDREVQGSSPSRVG